ncbi:MAG: GatB/YqeY domain-containing protein [Thermodesulfovibrionales bacterium]|nr:GatB/YqeY domain-containing protein [Thermodesulfovibrionales bacterium]
MDILAKVDSDLKEALKQKDEIRLSVLRLIKASTKNKEIQKQSPLNEEDIISVLSSMIKQRKESIEHYQKASRSDLVQREEKEIEIIKSYLPQELSTQELDNIISEAIKESNAVSVNDIGKVMRLIMPKVKGRADGKYINERVKAFLQDLG